MKLINNLKVSKVLITGPDTKVSDLLKTMIENSISIAIVRDGKVLGTVSKERLEKIERPEEPVSQFINENVITVTGDEDSLYLLSLLLKNKLDCLVLTKRNKILGALTLSDLLYSIQKRAELS
ncbi:MAG: CBS domain-containing protein [Metallosphaera sp.]|uniref:CBS domain-containing protein n=1 Tax=Metallosphaera sp. TaxID=2020860 RepID=UPI00317E56DA